MPVLRSIEDRFVKERPLKGLTIGCCLHITSETANLLLTLKSGGAKVVACASNPLSTQDMVAASLVRHYDISVFAIKGEDSKTYYKHLNTVLDYNPRNFYRQTHERAGEISFFMDRRDEVNNCHAELVSASRAKRNPEINSE